MRQGTRRGGMERTASPAAEGQKGDKTTGTRRRGGYPFLPPPPLIQDLIGDLYVPVGRGGHLFPQKVFWLFGVGESFWNSRNGHEWLRVRLSLGRVG